MTSITRPPIPDTDRSPSARRVHLASAAPTPSPRPDALDLSVLSDIALGLGQAERLWRPHVHHDPLSRTSVRLLATEAYEVWLLGWTEGQRVELHDHGDANAAFVVLEGVLDEVTLGFAGTTHQRLGPGEIRTVAAGAVHDVVNTSDRPATSLHVYSAPLETMTFFELEGSPRHTEVVEPVPALISGHDVARALHPAVRP